MAMGTHVAQNWSKGVHLGNNLVPRAPFWAPQDNFLNIIGTISEPGDSNEPVLRFPFDGYVRLTTRIRRRAELLFNHYESILEAPKALSGEVSKMDTQAPHSKMDGWIPKSIKKSSNIDSENKTPGFQNVFKNPPTVIRNISRNPTNNY